MAHGDHREPGRHADHLAATNAVTPAGAIPAQVPVNARPIVTAGLANDVDDVNQWAAPMQASAAAAMTAALPPRLRALPEGAESGAYRIGGQTDHLTDSRHRHAVMVGTRTGAHQAPAVLFANCSRRLPPPLAALPVLSR